jgi:hypothetical protein
MGECVVKRCGARLRRDGRIAGEQLWLHDEAIVSSWSVILARPSRLYRGNNDARPSLLGLRDRHKRCCPFERHEPFLEGQPDDAVVSRSGALTKSAHPMLETLPPTVPVTRETLIAPAARSATFHRLERLPLDLIGRCHDCQNCNEEIIGMCTDCGDGFLCRACFKAH